MKSQRKCGFATPIAAPLSLPKHYKHPKKLVCSIRCAKGFLQSDVVTVRLLGF